MSNTGIAPAVGATTISGTTVGGYGLGIAPGAASLINLNGNSPLQYPIRPSLVANQNQGVWTYTWAALTNGAYGQATTTANLEYGSACAQITGTFGSGGSIQLDGSMDGINWATLSPGAVTSAKLVYLAAGEQPNYIRAHCTAGDSTTNLNVVLQLASVH